MIRNMKLGLDYVWDVLVLKFWFYCFCIKAVLVLKSWVYVDVTLIFFSSTWILDFQFGHIVLCFKLGLSCRKLSKILDIYFHAYGSFVYYCYVQVIEYWLLLQVNVEILRILCLLHFVDYLSTWEMESQSYFKDSWS